MTCRSSRACARLVLGAVALFAGACFAPAAHAAQFTPGNVLVVSQQKLIEYTPAGVAVQTIPVPTGAGTGGPDLRDLMVDPAGNVQIYQGTGNPTLTQYDPTTGAFTRRAGTFSTANNLSYGGLAVGGGSVYVTDMDTNGSPSRGLARYPLAGGSPSVLGAGIEYIDVTLGRNGRLYALRGGGPNAGGVTIDSFDPATGASLGTTSLVSEVRAIAVDERGEFYGVDFFNPIRHFNAQGQIVGELPDTVGGLSDIDLDARGMLVLASHSGEIAFTATDFRPITGFNHRHTTDFNFVTWADPGTPVPEPAAGVAVLVVAGAAALRRRR